MNGRRAALIGLLVASLVLLSIAIVWRPIEPTDRAPATGLDVIVVGIDGLDWFLVGRYIEEGALPTLDRLVRSAVRAEVTPAHPLVPDAGWTVLGRGRDLMPEERSLLEAGPDRRLFGILPDVVRIADEAGKSAISIGWPASWPAPESGVTVAAPYAPDAPEHALSVAPTFFAGAPGQASSQELSDRIDLLVERNETFCAGAFEEEIYGGPPPSDPIWEEHLAAAEWGYLADRVVLDLAAGLIAQQEPDLALVYMGGLDAIGHRFLAPALPEYFQGSRAPEAYEAVLLNYYRFVDAALARLLRLADRETVFIVCSVYGTHPSVEVPDVSGSHAEGPPGVLIVRAPNLSPQQAPLSVAPADFAPTILAALGVPIPTDLDGRMLIAALPSWLLERFPPDFVPSERPAPEPVEVPALEAMDGFVGARIAGFR